MLGLGVRRGARRTIPTGGAAGQQPVALSPIPYQKIKTGVAGSYNIAQHASGATYFAPAPGEPPLQAGVTLSAAGLLSWTTTPTPQMNNYVVIRATNLASGLYVDLVRMRCSVAQDPGVAPAPTLTALNATTIRFAQAAVPANVPPIQVDLLEGPTSPLTSANGQVRYGAMTGLTQLDLTFATGTVRRAKLRYRIDWGDGTFFPTSFTASPESNVIMLSPGTSAPSALVQLSITPASGPVGTIFTIALGTVDGSPTPTNVLSALTLGATDVLASAVLQSPDVYTYTSTIAGALTASSLAQNGTLPDLPQSAGATVSAAITVPNQPAPPSMAAVSSSEIDATMPSDPPDGGASIDRRELDYSFDATNWTTIIDPALTRTFVSLAAQSWLYLRYRVRNSVGYSVYSTVASAQTQAAPGSSLVLNELSRDRVIYDSGAALGRDYADIPFSGTASPGAIVQGRLYSLDDGGATSSVWADIGAADGSGNWSGLLSGILNESWYRKEVRLKALPNVTAAAVNRCAVGHMHVIWGQSAEHRLNQTSFSNTASDPLLSVAQQVDRLVLQAMTGRNSTNSLKVVGVDALPSGASLAARTITLTGTGLFEDWDIQDYQLKANFGARWKLRQCLIREVVGSLAPNYLLQMMRGGRIDTERCTMYGLPGSSLDAVIREEGSGGGATYGKSTHKRLRITNFPADGAKVVAAEFYDCYIKSVQNLKKVPTLYNAGTTYAVDDYVYITAGGNIYAYASLQAGNLNNQPPTDGTSNAFWSRKAPHSDGINPTECCEKIIVRRTIVDFSQANIANGSVGITSNFRCETTAAQYILTGGIEISYSIFDRDPSSPQWPITITGGFTTNVQVERSRFTPRGSDGRVITPGSATVNWADNAVKSNGATIATPSGCVAATSVLKTNDDVVQMLLHNRSNAGAAGIVHRYISSASPYTSALVAMANVLLAERPGEKFAIVWQTLSGTGFTERLNDASGYWADDFALHQYATADGVVPGLINMEWTVSPVAMAQYYGQGVFEMAVGTKMDGSALATVSGKRQILTGTGQSATFDHLFSDIYDVTKTKWLLWGTARFSINNDMLDATHASGGAIDTQKTNAQACRASMRAMIADSRATMFLKDYIDPLNYQVGQANNAPAWGDLHPSDNSKDGLERFAVLHAHANLRSAGLTRYVPPQFDNSAWQADGSYVEVWSSAGPITTTRLARAVSALPATYNHWTEVFGWQINGAPARRAEIVAGRVRIYPIAAAFQAGDIITFGEGGATGEVKWPEDPTNHCWMNLPIVDLGMANLEGTVVRSLPAAAALTNTIVGAPTFTTANTGPVFRETGGGWPAAQGKFTFLFDGQITNVADGPVLCQAGNLEFTLQLLTNSGLRVTVKDSAGTTLINAATVTTITPAARNLIILTIDLAANSCWVKVNGTTVYTNTSLAANTGQLCGTGRVMSLNGSKATTPITIVAGVITEIAVWRDAVSGGGRPASAPLRQILGPASVANADGWKMASTSNAT